MFIQKQKSRVRQTLMILLSEHQSWREVGACHICAKCRVSQWTPDILGCSMHASAPGKGPAQNLVQYVQWLLGSPGQDVNNIAGCGYSLCLSRCKQCVVPGRSKSKWSKCHWICEVAAIFVRHVPTGGRVSSNCCRDHHHFRKPSFLAFVGMLG